MTTSPGRAALVVAFAVLLSAAGAFYGSKLTIDSDFGGLILSFYPGLRSIGWLALLGIGATLVSALLFFPALLQFLEDRSAREAVRRSRSKSLPACPPPTVVGVEPG